jgi:hypothetical protein
MSASTSKTTDLVVGISSTKTASYFVWGAWALMLTVALVFVWRFGSNVPSWDDWDMVPTMTGNQPVTWNWLWSQHNEHRIPVPRIINLMLYWGVALDFRVGMYFNVLMMGAVAFAMIIAAKRLRGRIDYPDAFFPVLLLNLGQGLNFIWSWQVEFFVSTAVACIVLLFVLQSRPYLSVIAGAAVGFCLILLSMSGAHGVALVPALALWLAIVGIIRWHSGERRSRPEGIIMLGFAALGFILTGLYFVGYEKVPYHPTSPDLKATLFTALKFLTMGFGSAVREVWPLSGIAVLCFLLFTGIVLCVVMLKHRLERTRALGLAAFMGGMFSLALGLGLGRDGFEPRYITLSVAIWCCVYFITVIYVPAKSGFFLQLILLLATCSALWVNTRAGLAYGEDLRNRLASFEQEMANGVPSYQLISEYAGYLHPHHDIPQEYMPMLREAGVGSFRFLQDDPQFRHVTIPITPLELNQVRLEGNVAYALGSNPYMVFALSGDRYVSGILLKYSYSNNEGTCPYISVYWKRSDQKDFTSEQFKKYSPTGDKANWCSGTWRQVNESEKTMIVWVRDTVGEIRINPDFKPGVFTISQIDLLEPPNE